MIGHIRNLTRCFFYVDKVFFSAVLLAVFILFGGVNEAPAAVVVDTASNNATFDATGVTTLTWSHTTGTGTSRALFVGVSTASTNIGNPAARVTSVTYGSQTLTRVTNGFRVSPDSNNAVELFQLINPTSGTNTITVNLLPAASNYVVGGSVSFTGVNQTTPTGTFISNTNQIVAPTTLASITVNDSVAGDLVLDVIGSSFNAQDLIPDTAQTRQYRQLNDTPNPPPPFYVGAGSTKPGAAQAVTTMWTLQTAQNWALGAVAIKQSVATAAEVTVSGRISTTAGRGVRGARVTITDSNGEIRTALTNSFGYYRFANVNAGETYVMNAFSKQHSFSPQIVTVNEDLTERNFVARP